MRIEQAALAALYPVTVVLCLVGCFRFWPALKNLDGAMKTLIQGVLIMLLVLGIENTYYGITRFHLSFYESFGMNVWIVGTMKLGYIVGLSLILRAYWEITESNPSKWAPALTALIMWVVLMLFQML